MTRSLSPLRYPGGKTKIYKRVRTLIETADLGDRTYIEPFAGGFGLGVSLLLDGVVKDAVLNDYDKHIYNFWKAVLDHTEDLIKLIDDTPISVDERETQKTIYDDSSSDELQDGFATLFLNRVNYSGVIKGGPIGGVSQSGKYKIDCRFNKEEIKNRIRTISKFQDHILLFNKDASDLIVECVEDSKDKAFFNIDPPYVAKGSKLYTNYFRESDHRDLEQVISANLQGIPWITTYDDCGLIREIYEQYYMLGYSIQHNVRNSIVGEEVVITNIPQESFVW